MPRRKTRQSLKYSCTFNTEGGHVSWADMALNKRLSQWPNNINAWMTLDTVVPGYYEVRIDFVRLPGRGGLAVGQLLTTGR